MKLVSSIILVLASCVFIQYTEAKITITRFENCDVNVEYPIKMTLKMRENNEKQVVEEGTFSSKIEIGNNIRDIAEIYSKEDDGQYMHLLTINENLCDAMNKFMGEFMHDLQEAAGIKRGTCPVPAGDYTVKEHELDFSKFKFKKIPEGEFRAKVSLLDSANNNTLHCHFLEFKLEK